MNSKTRIPLLKAITYLVFLFPAMMFAQPANDDCLRATLIPSTDNYCSVTAEFTTQDATSSGLAAANCFTGANNDVWFVFSNAAPAITLTITGAVAGTSNTLTRPQVEIYRTTDCLNFNAIGAGLACASAAGQNNNVQLTWSGLTIGELVYVRVQSGNGGDGTFQFCVDNFFPPANPGSDCIDAAVLCDKSSFSVQSVQGAGNDRNENRGTCLDVSGDSEEQSIWFKWTARTSGNLTLDLIPLLITDDLDFVMYQLPNGLENCDNKVAVRCNANFTGGQSPCGGTSTTGMRPGEPNANAQPGCPGGDNGYVSDFDLVAGQSYALVVNNFTQSGSGFRVEWGGSAEFEGPVPDFELSAIGAFECDKRITITNLSFSNVDTIVNYTWNFGAGAMPQTATGPGPHEINYESFGLKSVVLTVESSEGCLISSAQNIDIAACCRDFNDLVIDTLAVGDVLCAGDDNGFIELTGTSGNPPYSYRISEDDPFLPISRFEGLTAGIYDVEIVDIKGCTDQMRVIISEPPPLILQLNNDETIRLGTSKNLTSFYSPGNRPVSISWTPTETLSCDDCFFPIATPTGNTTYLATITDSTGCTATDSVRLRVEAIRDVYIPNAFTPGNDGLNNFFSVYGGIDVAPNGILELRVFNRWGGMVYSAENIPFGNQSNEFGWDGRVDGLILNPGVYVYMARILFLDGVEIVYSGDVTLVR